MTDTMTLVSEGERVVVGIELPKNPDSPSRKVSFAPEGNEKYKPVGWIYADELGDITIGTLVSYRIEKNADGFNTITHLAPVVGKAAGPDAGTAPQRPAARDDSDGGQVPTSPAPQAVPNQDTARFESYAFLAACGMVDLAYEELSDAKNAGTVEKVTAVLVRELADAMLFAADAAQREIVGHVNRNAQSHTRARGAVRTALRSYRYEGETVDWGAALTRAAITLLQVAASL